MIPFCCGDAPSVVGLRPWCIVSIRSMISGLCALVAAFVLIGVRREWNTRVNGEDHE